jgi:hypothetical protein
VEAISPELALIDPELARAHLEWLEISSGVSPAAGAVAGPVARARPAAPALVEPRWLGAATVLAALSLAANGFLVSVIVARDDTRPAAAPAAEVAAPAPPAVPDATAPIRTSAAIEQRLLALVVQSESRRLPRTLVDPVTGLPKDNLQAVCRDGPSGSELCIVRPAEHRAGEGLAVRYIPSGDGTGTFVWSPYRSG